MEGSAFRSIGLRIAGAQHDQSPNYPHNQDMHQMRRDKAPNRIYAEPRISFVMTNKIRNLNQTILANLKSELALAIISGNEARELELRRLIAEMRAQVELEAAA